MSTQQLDEEVIFNVARKIDPLHGRANYLRQSFGNNTSLLARVQALLDVHDGESSFLACPIEDHRADHLEKSEQPEITERPGPGIGPYKLLEQRGEGGL